MPPMTGRVIAGRYSLQHPIGRGAMGIVWRARDQILDREVAVKEVVISDLIGEDERRQAYQRTLREARTAGRLSHRGVVAVYDVAEEDGRPWIIMELVPSRSLDQVLAVQRRLSPLRAGRIGQQLLSALAHAHACGVLHRDVKPSNVLIATERTGGPDGWDERAVLTDFGIAQFEGDPRLTQTGMVMGSPGFTAPERIRGGGATPASDLWSLGATIYTAVEGRGPYEQRGGAITTMSAIIHEDAPVAPHAGRLAPLIAALLRRNPAERPSASAAARMFAQVLPLLADAAPAPPAPHPATVRSPQVPLRQDAGVPAEPPPAADRGHPGTLLVNPGKSAQQPGEDSSDPARSDAAAVEPAARAAGEPPAAAEPASAGESSAEPASAEPASAEPASAEAVAAETGQEARKDADGDVPAAPGAADADAADADAAAPGVSDAGVSDAGVSDAGVSDAGVSDAGAAVPGAGEGEAAHAEAPGAEAPGAEAPGADSKPAGAPRAGSRAAGADSGAAGAEAPGAAAAEAGAPGAQAPEAGTGDAGTGDGGPGGEALPAPAAPVPATSVEAIPAAAAVSPAGEPQTRIDAPGSGYQPTELSIPVPAQPKPTFTAARPGERATPTFSAARPAQPGTANPQQQRAGTPQFAGASGQNDPFPGSTRPFASSGMQYSGPSQPYPDLAGQYPPGTGGGRARRRGTTGRRVIMVVAAMLAAAAIGAGAALAARGHGTAGAASPAKAQQPADPVTAFKSVNALNHPTTIVPAGWRQVTVPSSAAGSTAGFSIALPPGWTEHRNGLATGFTGPGNLYLDIDLTPHTKHNMVAEARFIEEHSRAEGKFPGYRRLHLEAVPVRGTRAAIWQFTWQPAGNARLIADDILFVMPTQAGSQSCAVYIRGKAGEWGSKDLPIFDSILSTFQTIPAS